MNPMKQLKEEHGRAKAELKRLEGLYGALKRDHEKLIEANVALENNFNRMFDGLVQFCENCPEQGSALCQGCRLHEWLY